MIYDVSYNYMVNHIELPLFEVKLPYEPSCPSVGRTVGLPKFQVSLPKFLSDHLLDT